MFNTGRTVNPKTWTSSGGTWRYTWPIADTRESGYTHTNDLGTRGTSGGVPVSVNSFVEKIEEEIDSVEYDRQEVQRWTEMLSPNISFSTRDTMFPPFVHVSPLTKPGAISVFNVDQVFITETDASCVAWMIFP